MHFLGPPYVRIREWCCILHPIIWDIRSLCWCLALCNHPIKLHVGLQTGCYWMLGWLNLFEDQSRSESMAWVVAGLKLSSGVFLCNVAGCGWTGRFSGVLLQEHEWIQPLGLGRGRKRTNEKKEVNFRRWEWSLVLLIFCGIDSKCNLKWEWLSLDIAVWWPGEQKLLRGHLDRRQLSTFWRWRRWAWMSGGHHVVLVCLPVLSLTLKSSIEQTYLPACFAARPSMNTKET